MKITRQHLANSFNRAKNFIGTAYNNTKNVLSNVDNGARLFKHIYGAAQPIIDQYVGHNNNLNKNIIKALSGYDNIRNQAMEAHDGIENNINSLRNNLAKKNIKFNFA